MQTKEHRDALLAAINTEMLWEYHPFLPLERTRGPVLTPEPGILYRPTLVEEEMWLFIGVPLLPVETIEMRATSGTIMIMAHNEMGVRGLFEGGWILAEGALRKEK